MKRPFAQGKRTSSRCLDLLYQLVTELQRLRFMVQIFFRQEVEGAIFVVPGVVESVPQQADDLIRQTLAEYREFDGDLDDVSPNERVPAARPRPPVVQP